MHVGKHAKAVQALHTKARDTYFARNMNAAVESMCNELLTRAAGNKNRIRNKLYDARR